MARGSMPACAVAIGSLALLGVAVPAYAATGSADLGGPDVYGYCQHLGFAGAGFSPPPNRQWQCVRADGSTAPVDMQAACEFSFSERPILARQLTPGVPYTWQCNAGAGGAAGGGAQPTAAQLRSSLLADLRPVGSAARIRALRRKGSYAMRFRALTAGTLRVSWSHLAKGSHGGKAKSVTVAAGRLSVSHAGTLTVKIVLSAAGRRLLKSARRVTIAARGSFSVSGQPALLAVVRFTLSR